MKIRLGIARNLIGFFVILTPKAFLTIGFQDRIVLCIVSSTAAHKIFGSNKQRKELFGFNFFMVFDSSVPISFIETCVNNESIINLAFL